MGKDKKEKDRKKRDRDNDITDREQKKLRKKAEKVAKAFGYSNETNPFGDSNLLQPFVWKKKIESESKKDARREDPEVARLQLIHEIDNVRKRRLDRERELEDMQRMRDEEQRLREALQYDDWEEKEEEFHMAQTKERSKIRLVEKRVKAIDLLARNILLIESILRNKDEEDELTSNLVRLKEDISDPCKLVEDLSVSQLSDLQQDLRDYLSLEKKQNGTYTEFWTVLDEIVTIEMKKKRFRDGVHRSVSHDIKRTLAGKSPDDLLALAADIRSGIRDGTRHDVEYWELMEQEILLERSKCRLRDMHAELQRKQHECVQVLRDRLPTSSYSKYDRKTVAEPISTAGEDYRFVDYKSAARLTVPDEDTSKAAQLLFERERERGCGEDEEELMRKDEVALDKQYSWQDRYTPRKPKYYNRVRTGVEWNKYNKAHYDADNPPPKSILGYRFSIFYPDLVDPMVTPQFRLEPCDDPDMVLLRFVAGAPYEDIAFKISNRQWDKYKKSDYRCVFENGVLQLNFDFKLHKYCA